MAEITYDRATQALLLSPANLQLGVVSATSGGAHNFVADASFTTKLDFKEIKVGYPARTISAVVSKYGATASLNTRDMVAAKSLLGTIAASTIALGPPSTTLSLVTHAPAGTGLTLSLASPVLLQQFSISGTQDDFHAIQFEYEAAGSIAGTSPTWADFITVTSVGSGGTFLPSANPAVMGLGMPRITVGGASLGAIQGFSLQLSSEYKKHESGFPAVVAGIYTLSHSLTLSVEAEEFGTKFNYPSGTELDVSVTIGYGSGSITISFTAVASGTAAKLSPGNFSTASMSFIGIAPAAGQLFTVT